MSLRVFHDPHAEALLLGCALRDLETARSIVAHVRDEDVGEPAHLLILTALREAVEAGKAPILEGVRRRLYTRGVLDEIGSYTALDDLAALPPTSLHWAAALNACRCDAYRGKHGIVVQDFERLHNEGAEPAALQRAHYEHAAELERWLPGFLADATLDEILDRVRQERARRISGETAGLTWGLNRLDTIADLHAGALYLIVGDSSHLKSALVIHAAAAMLSRQHRLLVLPLEEGPDNWLVKLACRLSGVPMNRAFRPEHADAETLRVLESAEDDLRDCKDLILADLNRVKGVGDLAAHVEQYRPAVVLVDYLQQFPRTNPRENEESHLSRLGQELQRLAATSGTCIVAVSSINRSGAAADGKPTCHSIRGSHGLVHSPHAILGLHFPHRLDGTQPKDAVEIGILKNKTGEVAAYSSFPVEPAICRFYDDDKRVLYEDRQGAWTQGEVPF